jgi:hypothetical protein
VTPKKVRLAQAITLGYSTASIGIRFVSRPHHVVRAAELAVAILLTVITQVAAIPIDAKSVSLADVSSAIASAHDGDTVVVPAGSASWTSTLTITKGITLQGASKNETVILDDIPRNQSREQPAKEGQLKRPGRGSILANAGPMPPRGGPGGSSGGAILRIALTPRQSFRLTGFTFRCGSVAIANHSGAVNIKGTCPSIRLDHCHFDQLYGSNVFVDGWLYGVIDHCTFDIRARGGGPIVRVFHSRWGNQPSGWGSWADPPYFGSEKFIFIEDNVINNRATAPERGGIDAGHGGRFVARYNTFNNCNIFYHGSDTGVTQAYYRGTRAVEIYSNRFNATTQAVSPGQDRGGPLIWHDNTYTGPYHGGMALAVYRLNEYEAHGFLGADGTSPWDCNATEPDGTHVDGHPPYTYATGTHIGGNDSTTVTVAGTPWQPNEWVGYSVANTNRASPYYRGFNIILSNTNNTLTLGNIRGANPPPKFNNGDTFAIHKVLIVIDQPGRGQGDLIGGNLPTHRPIPAWPHQALEPCYSWNNTLNGKNLNFTYNPANTLLKENVDFYNNTPMPGYKPYIYPHPLIKEDTKPSQASKKN